MRTKWGPESRVGLSVSEIRDVSTKKGPVRDVCVSQSGCSLIALSSHGICSFLTVVVGVDNNKRGIVKSM